MWKHAFTAVASASVLVLGVALPGAPADARADSAMPAAGARVAAAVAAETADARLSLAGQVALGDAALRTLEQHRVDAALAAAAEARRVAEQKAAQEAAARAAEQAAAAQAAATEASAKKPAKKPAAGHPPAPPAPAGPGFAWRTSIVNSGGQDAVDRCLGGLTRWHDDVDGKPYYPIHRSCGGTPILGLHRGDRVRIDGGTWVVTDYRDVPKGSHYSAAAGLAGQILLQTCYRNSTTMRIVALTAG